jgi:hypothetical protein
MIAIQGDLAVAVLVEDAESGSPPASNRTSVRISGINTV